MAFRRRWCLGVVSLWCGGVVGLWALAYGISGPLALVRGCCWPLSLGVVVLVNLYTILAKLITFDTGILWKSFIVIILNNFPIALLYQI